MAFPDSKGAECVLAPRIPENNISSQFWVTQGAPATEESYSMKNDVERVAAKA